MLQRARDAVLERLLTKSWSFAANVVIADQISKFLIALFSKTSPLYERDVFVFTLRIVGGLNPNFAFSIPAPFGVVLVGVLAVLGAVLYWWWQELKVKSLGVLPLALVIGGAVSNLIDRVRLGGVYDWIEVGIRGVSASHFNLADVAIVAGILAYLAMQKRTETI